ncbi:MAG TPA: PPOX class F420-dependent oxidoreductase [Roseiflexaceae bacterium]|nr:PPOX class F420-dependent oxidoreductase [Roseiflexaceae bacterium]
MAVARHATIARTAAAPGRGRMATVNQKGDLHVVPVGFRYNPETDTIDIGGHNFASSKKYRDAVRHGRIAFVVDDVLPPWRPRFVEVRGTVQAFAQGGKRSMNSLRRTCCA